MAETRRSGRGAHAAERERALLLMYACTAAVLAPLLVRIVGAHVSPHHLYRHWTFWINLWAGRYTHGVSGNALSSRPIIDENDSRASAPRVAPARETSKCDLLYGVGAGLEHFLGQLRMHLTESWALASLVRLTATFGVGGSPYAAVMPKGMSAQSVSFLPQGTAVLGPF